MKTIKTLRLASSNRLFLVVPCTVDIWENENYQGNHHGYTCSSSSCEWNTDSWDIDSVKINGGGCCIELWDEDKCRTSYEDNLHTCSNVPKLVYDLRDDVCKIKITPGIGNHHCDRYYRTQSSFTYYSVKHTVNKLYSTFDTMSTISTD